jgi:3-deoxy-D-manno-octulosonic-acid transferase
LGEFEQGRPLMEKIKKQYPNTKILLTFFSPSGYEIQNKYASVDYVFYLPMGTPHNAKKFIEIIKPKIAFFIKYEFWFNYLNALKKRNIPIYLISGIFRENHYFLKWYGAWFKRQLNCFTHFYLQDEQSEQSMKLMGYHNITVTGDTRFDRVFEISKNAKQIEIVKQFITDKKVMIAGSTWEEDEKIISGFKFKISGFKLIIAPHEIGETHIQSIIRKFNSYSVLRYSEAAQKDISSADILIIDNIGILSSIYQYGTIAYIGGGFGKGIHNILEPATFGLPIIFGPNYHKFIEACELIDLHGAFSVSSAEELKKIIDLLAHSDILKTASLISKSYVSSRVGATNKILKSIFGETL